MKKLILGLIVSVALFGCGEKTNVGGKPTAEDINAGKGVAARDCKGCHGLDGKGVAPGIPHLAAQRERYLLASLKEYKEGKRMHAALRDLAVHMSDKEMQQVVAYYSSLNPIVVAASKDATPSSPYQEGKALAAQCASCHGEDGNSKTPGTPTLAGQQAHYLVAAIQEYHQGDRKSSNMSSMLVNATKVDVEKLALYYASQKPAQRPAPTVGDPVAGEPATAMCGGCHGARGVSTDSATPSLAGQDAKYLVNSMNSYRKERKNWGMERYVAGLNDKDIQNIAAYYAVQQSKAADEEPSSIKDLVEKCNRCHSADNNPTVAMPSMNGQDKDYLIMSIRAYRDGKRQSSMMHNMSFSYSNAMIESIATWYANQPAGR
jgi:cytochrome c553